MLRLKMKYWAAIAIMSVGLNFAAITASATPYNVQTRGQATVQASCAIRGPHGNPNLFDVVINKKRCYTPTDFIPRDLVSYNGFFVSAKIMPGLAAMFDAAATASVPLRITSAYRSYGDQA